MNTKGIIAVKDENICMKCLKKKAVHTYSLYDRGYGSIYDSRDTKFQCCDDCYRPVYRDWFNELPKDGYFEVYKYEEDISNLIKSLPLEGRELFENRFNNGYKMEPQDWIDYELDELPYDKCKEYGLYAPEDINAYKTKFPTCENVVNIIYNDGSKGSRCPFGTFGKYNQEVDINIYDNCTLCKYYKKREIPIKQINRKELNDWITYKKFKLNEKELDKKFG